MNEDIARARQAELFSNPLRMTLRAEAEQLRKVARLQRALSVAQARLGLLPAVAN